MLHNPYVGRMVIYFYDDTLRKKAEAALMDSQKMLKQQADILDHVSDIIVTGDMNYVITSWNNIAEEMTGITASEAIGKNYREIIPLDYSPFTATDVRTIVLEKGVWRGETSFINKSGGKKVHLDSISLMVDETGNKTGYLVVGKDITERKRIEDKLQKSESFYRSLIANSLDGIVLTDQYGVITYCSPSVIPLSGYDPGEIIGRNLFEFVHPDDLAKAQDAFVKEMSKQSIFYYILLRLRHSNGNWV
jgi:PAS domain S-box-containing protein